MFNFTALLGAQSSSAASQSLLEFDGGVKVLVDVGWDQSFDVEKLRELEKHIPTISLVLLTHATASHLGAFAHCCKHFPQFARIPVYATTPVRELGRSLLQDIYASTPLSASVIPPSALSEAAYSIPRSKDGVFPNLLLQPPTAEEIATYFNLIHPLRYSQTHEPLPAPNSPPLNGLTITAYSAGHTLGGTIWHITHGLESIVYAVDWNQAKELVLSGAAWLGGAGGGGAEVIEQLRRPTAMICSSKGAEKLSLAGGRQKRDELLLSMIRETVAKGGSVLIPTDSSARMLELAYLLESAWTAETEGQGLHNARPYLACRTCGASIKSVQSMLEWMDDSIQKSFEAAAANVEKKGTVPPPFEFRHLKMLERKGQVNRVLGSNNPHVILASDTTLDWGFSKTALLKLAEDKANLVILTERASSLKESTKGAAKFLWDVWHAQRADETAAIDVASNTVDAEGSAASIAELTVQPLADPEMPIYQEYLAQRRQLQTTLQTEQGTTLETSADAVDERSDESSESSDDEDAEQQGKLLNTSASLQNTRHKLGLTDAELGINVLVRRRGVHDFDTRGKKGREKMFPFVAKRRRADEFGELIRPEEYLRAEERDDVDGEDMRGGAAQKEAAVGQKRKWDDVSKTAGQTRPGGDAAPKRIKSGLVGAPLQNGVDGGPVADTPNCEVPDDDVEEPEESQIEGPKKAVITLRSLEIQCRIGYVDFSGLHDKRSLQMLIPLIKPRKLILVAGEEAETLSLAEECKKLLSSGTDSSDNQDLVFTPKVGIQIDASVDTNAWAIKLSRSLVKKLRWQDVRGMGVVSITGRIDIEEESESGAVKKKMKTETAEEPPAATSSTIGLTPILDVVPSHLATATRSLGQPLHVGEVKLAALRRLMQASGFSAEFRGEGTLLIDGSVVVRKSGTGRVEVESSGGLGITGRGSSFQDVKRSIYENLAVVG